MNKDSASKGPVKAKAANAPQPPSAKAPAPKPVSAEAMKVEPAKTEPAKTEPVAAKEVKEPVKKAETTTSTAAATPEKKAGDYLKDAGKSVDSVANTILDTFGAKNFPKVPGTQAEKRRSMLITYALFGASVVYMLPTIFAYVFYIRKLKPTMAGTIWESHMIWLERTFLIAFPAALVGFLFYGTLGWTIPVLAVIYIYYRVIKGYLRYDENKAIENPQAWY